MSAPIERDGPDEWCAGFAEMTAEWAANEYEIHKRPPFRAHSFDNDGRFWVVGTSGVSVLHGWHGTEEGADFLARKLNNTPAVRRVLETRHD